MNRLGIQTRKKLSAKFKKEKLIGMDSGKLYLQKEVVVWWGCIFSSWIEEGCLSRGYYSTRPSYKLTRDLFKARGWDFDAALISLNSDGPVCLRSRELHRGRQLMSEGGGGAPVRRRAQMWRETPDVSDARQRRGVTRGGCGRWRRSPGSLSRPREAPPRRRRRLINWYAPTTSLNFAADAVRRCAPNQLHLCHRLQSKRSPLQSAICQLEIKPAIIIIIII